MTKIDRDAVLMVGAALFAARLEQALTPQGLECLANAAVNIALALEAAIPRAEAAIAEEAKAVRAKAAAEKAEANELAAHALQVTVAEQRAERAAAHLAEVKAAKPGRPKLRAVA